MSVPDFDTIHAELRPKIRRYLSRLVGTAEADDLTQEVFARVARALDRFRGDSSVSTWVYAIATNAAYDRLRRAPAGGGPALFQIGRLPADPAAGIERVLIRQEMSECIGRHVAALPPAYRSVLLLSEDEGLSNQEIADALGISLPTVKIRLHRARARLRRELGDACDVYRDGDNELACDPRPAGGAYPAAGSLRLHGRREEV